VTARRQQAGEWPNRKVEVAWAVSIGLAVLIPALHTRMYRTFGVVGVGVIATAVILGITGW
jgi:hypothetical protein